METTEKKRYQAGQPERLVLTGFRATGKTSVGRTLAARLGYDFLDTDQELCARIGCTIAEYVAQQGWPAFRALERQLLEELAHRSGLVVASGGGAILHQEAWTRLRAASLVVWLQADQESIRQRLQADQRSAGQRPSLTGVDPGQEIAQVLAEREPLYRAGSDLAVDTVGLSAEKIAERIVSYLSSNIIN